MRDYEAAKNPGSYTTIAMRDRPGSEGHHPVGTYGAATAERFAHAINADHLGRGWLDTAFT